MSEIEIKFVTRERPLAPFISSVLPAIEKAGYQISREPEVRLQNDYYDTPEHHFQNEKMGFRVRGCNGVFEQTMKTHGKVSGGLHQRAEYNIDLVSAEPDLTLFDKNVWPSGWHVEQVNRQLERQFSTHFVRTAFNITLDSDSIEVVVDEGEATTGKNSAPIREVELELKAGSVASLFTLAKIIARHTPVRLSDVSKAAQGYQLLSGISPVVVPLSSFLPLQQQETTEAAFCSAVQHALSHWQKHEHLFYETGSVKVLAEIVKCARLLMQTVSLYLPVLQCPQLLAVHQLLMAYMQDWLWQDDLQSLRYLLSKKSLFNKCLSKFPALISYLQGRKAGLIHAHDPESLFFSGQSNELKLALAEIVAAKPWRSHSKAYDVPVMEHAQGWLSQGWQTVQQTLPKSRNMTPENYIAIEVLLRQTLWNGYLLAGLFDEERHHFRAPWLDILTGIDEMKALLMLRAMANESELDDIGEVLTWVEEKLASLMRVMERTRQAGMQGDIYW
ncbi:inorganic triphosphatase [Aestuariibacter sp. A3R04]|uniref:CYTH domain-containing protein n=1 Tax=Aestuariibacter sp. A3R04 TaxID=2841571 RepID=UPI001C09881F|nr:CYTH and CHAD domain-containing protein [Aestuariibacter sp. A3R04]MBU3021135.1 CYTH domain-containing protein [Aestuariibacter sp. A3R04]